MAKKKLTTKQQRFVEFYDGNGTEAARKAGYKGTYVTLRRIGSDNLTKPHILSAVRAREKRRNGEEITNREQRQRLWTQQSLCSDPQSKEILERIEAGLWQLGLPLKKSGLNAKEWGELNLKVGALYIGLQKNALKASELLGKSQADFVNINMVNQNVFTYAQGLEQLKKHLQGNPELENKIERNLLDFTPGEGEEFNKIIDIEGFVYNAEQKT